MDLKTVNELINVIGLHGSPEDIAGNISNASQGQYVGATMITLGRSADVRYVKHPIPEVVPEIYDYFAISRYKSLHKLASTNFACRETTFLAFST